MSASNDKMSSIVETFVKEYYRAFDYNAMGLFDFYQQDALFSMGDTKIAGKKEIVYMLNGYLFNKCVHTITKFDYQKLDTGVLLTVVGKIRLSTNQTKNFCQAFRLMPDSQEHLLVVANTILHMFE